MFKVQLHRKLEDSSDLSWDGNSKIETGYINEMNKMKRNDDTFFDDFRQLLLREFEDYGLSRNNYNILWQDKNGKWVIVKDNAEFILAMDELEGPEYKFIAQLDVGMYDLAVNI